MRTHSPAPPPDPTTNGNTFETLYHWCLGGEAGLSPHGLRALAVNTLLEAGCTPAEVAGITDQSLGIIERYARQRDQRKFARRAMGKWTSALEETDGER